jgi:alpha-tubulin suppressor-like RCC1 family protein
LAVGGEYHFRLVVSNAAGIVRGGESIFTTARPIWAWGNNNFGQGAAPPGVTNAMAIAGGRDFSLALLSDTTVAGWGRNDAGQISPPAALTNLSAIAAGLAHSLALLADGSVIAWGTNNFGQTNVPAGLGGVIAIAAGANHCLALRSNGTVVSWGLNTSGQTNVPGSLSNVVAVAAGFAHSLALKLDGTVVNWGSASGNVPAGVTNVTAIAAGGNHSLALRTNNKVTAWGQNSIYGEAVSPATLINVIAIAAGTNHNAALRRDGTLFFWGRNDLGQSSLPSGLTNCLAIAAGDNHTLALAGGGNGAFAATLPPALIRTTNAVLNGFATPNGVGAVAWFEWGTNAGFGRQTATTPLGGGIGVVMVSNSISGLAPYGEYRCRLVVSNAAGLVRGRDQLFTTGGRIRAWGSNAGGQTNVPLSVFGAVGVSAGSNFVVAVQNDGTVAAWGTNNLGQLNLPPGLTNVVSVAGGGGHALALKDDGRVVAWGRSDAGQTNVPAGLSNVIAIAAGDRHSLALRADGTVVGWGSNSTNQSTVPAGLSNVVAIAAAGNGSLTLKHDGLIVAWGSLQMSANLNSIAGVAACPLLTIELRRDTTVLMQVDNIYDPFGQTTVPAGLTNVVGIAVGDTHSLAVKSNTTVVAWGNNQLGQAPSPVAISNVVAIAAAGSYSVALVAGPAPARAITLKTTPLGPSAATLNGAGFGNDPSGFGWFQWGTNGTFTQSTAPVPLAPAAIVRIGAAISNLAPGGIYSCRMVATNFAGMTIGAEQRFTTGRKMAAWGRNNFNQTNTPPGLTNVVGVAGGASHSVALGNDGSVRAWGATSQNQTAVPPDLTNAIAIAAGANHTLALRKDGTIAAWGLNSSGQTTVPASASNVIAIACGSLHSLALRADGKVLAWGNNSSGQTTVPANLTNVVAIAGGGRHSLALRVDGTVAAWGDNGSGQCTVPANASNVVAIAAGDSYSMVSRAYTNVLVWGAGFGSLPFLAKDLVDLAAGFDFALAVRTNGGFLAWGNSSFGQIFAPGGATNLVSVAAGTYHSLLIGPNLAPAIGTQSFDGIANHDLIVAPGVSDANGDALSLRVISLPVSGLLYQCNGGVRGALIASAGTSLTDPAGRIVFAPATNAFGSPYASFSLIANDGEVDSAPGLLTLNFAAPVAPVFTSWTRNPNGGWQLVYSGDSNTTYCVWASTNLFTWQYLGPGVSSGPGQFTFMDDGAAAMRVRFYRVSTNCQ